MICIRKALIRHAFDAVVIIIIVAAFDSTLLAWGAAADLVEALPKLLWKLHLKEPGHVRAEEGDADLLVAMRRVRFGGFSLLSFTNFLRGCLRIKLRLDLGRGGFRLFIFGWFIKKAVLTVNLYDKIGWFSRHFALEQ
ncbi:hypothetical protein QQP08_018365 [Theobroma cacao]|nr:hypothetical protein QQP08_018365 [Theobroma cacao]